MTDVLPSCNASNAPVTTRSTAPATPVAVDAAAAGFDVELPCVGTFLEELQPIVLFVLYCRILVVKVYEWSCGARSFDVECTRVNVVRQVSPVKCQLSTVNCQ